MKTKDIKFILVEDYDTDEYLKHLIVREEAVDPVRKSENFFEFFIQRVVQKQEVIIPLPAGGIMTLGIKEIASVESESSTMLDGHHISRFYKLKLKTFADSTNMRGNRCGMTLFIESNGAEYPAFYEELKHYLSAAIERQLVITLRGIKTRTPSTDPGQNCQEEAL